MGVVRETGCAQQLQPLEDAPNGGVGVARALVARLKVLGGFFGRPVEILRRYELRNLRFDLFAGLTVAVIMLPQAVAFALIAELPPRMGLYSAIVGSIVGGLWGSSNQLQTGPSNTTSLLSLSVLLAVATPGTPDYLVVAGMMALMVGVFRLAMGLARLGVLVNFVSDAVIVGFTAGAGILIFFNQLRHLMRLTIPSAPRLDQTLYNVVTHLSEAHWPSLALGLGAILLISLLRRVDRRLPGPLVAMVGASAVVGLLGLTGKGIQVVGELPRGFPPLAELPILDFDLIGELATGSLAVAAIGLVESISIGRVIATFTGQRIDSDQEFVGQGLANIACGLLSGYPCSGSFTRSAVNFNAGAKTPLASVFAGILVLLAMLVLAPLAAYVPLPALAGVIILTAYRLIDRKEMVRIWHSRHGDRVIMVATLLATLALPLRFAVLVGIAMSLAYYLIRTSTPRVRTVLPDQTFRHFVHRPHEPPCPQLAIVEILGDLYFGAASHVEDSIQRNLERNPDQRFLLLRMHSVEHCDISGIHVLESIRRAYQERGGDVFLVRVSRPVLEVVKSTGYYDYLGADHFLSEDDAIRHLFYKVLDPAICIYECGVRAFKECQNLPKRLYPADVECLTGDLADEVATVNPRSLWEGLRDERPPLVIDVREPREFKRRHVPEARLVPLPALLADIGQVPRDRPVVLVCRGGRRSSRAARVLRERGYDNVAAMRGGMLAWEAANLLEAID